MRVCLGHAMRFTVRHETLYRYDTPVELAPHVLRLNPRRDGVRLLGHTLTITPGPASRHDETDRFGNLVTHLAFAGAADRFHIDSRFELHTVPTRTPAIALPPLPWTCAPDDGLACYRLNVHPDAAVHDFACVLASEAGHAALPFLEHLSRTLFARVDRHIRVDGAAQAPTVTLATRRGACRDITVLFLAACRALGMAGRFVSGYQARADTPDGRRHLHAWPEVLLPGIGWRGFDPTHGIPVSDGHVTLCAAPEQAGTMPVEGGFYGKDVTATLDYAVTIATTRSAAE